MTVCPRQYLAHWEESSEWWLCRYHTKEIVENASKSSWRRGFSVLVTGKKTAGSMGRKAKLLFWR